MNFTFKNSFEVFIYQVDKCFYSQTVCPLYVLYIWIDVQDYNIFL